MLAASLGALLYAIVNVTGDFAHDPAMTAVLWLSAALALASLAVIAARWR